jgi:hypothetical protein
MKQHANWFSALLAVASGLAITNSAQAQYTTTTLSDFNNFNLSATYANWDQDQSQIINGGSGYDPTLTSGATSFEVNAEGYGSGAYNFATALDVPGATMFSFTFTLNAPLGGTYYFNAGVDIADGTHLVHLTTLDAPNGGYLGYASYTAGTTYTVHGLLTDQFGGAPLDTTDITAFNLELDPAGNIPGGVYDITYDDLSLLTPTPEPTTLALLGLGAVTGVVIARRRGVKAS